MRSSKKHAFVSLRWVLVGLHSAAVVVTAACIYFTQTPTGDFGAAIIWSVFVMADMLVLPLFWLADKGVELVVGSARGGPLHVVVIPAILFGVLGGFQYYFLGMLMEWVGSERRKRASLIRQQ